MAKRKRISFDAPDAKTFNKIFQQLGYMHDAWTVWCDFVTMMACLFSVSAERCGGPYSAGRTELLDATAKKYTEEELRQFSELSKILIGTLDRDPEQDFLGNLYMSLDFGDSWRGQYFTPWNVAYMMAEMTIGDQLKPLAGRDYVSVCDPCCGAGVLLIAMAAAYRRNYPGHSYQQEVLFAAQDIDRVVALMCFVQLSLLGCAGYVVIGDSLRGPLCGSDLFPIPGDGYDIWYTPMWFHPTWELRRLELLTKRAQTGPPADLAG